MSWKKHSPRGQERIFLERGEALFYSIIEYKKRGDCMSNLFLALQIGDHIFCTLRKRRYDNRTISRFLCFPSLPLNSRATSESETLYCLCSNWTERLNRGTISSNSFKRLNKEHPFSLCFQSSHVLQLNSSRKPLPKLSIEFSPPILSLAPQNGITS